MNFLFKVAVLFIKTVNIVQMDYINTSHPNFIGGSKAVENALQQVKSSRVPLTVTRQKVLFYFIHTHTIF